jgi:hypothetical protein
MDASTDGAGSGQDNHWVNAVFTWTPDKYYALSDMTKQLKVEDENGYLETVTGFKQSLYRLACYEDGQCLLVRDSDGYSGPPSCCSGGYDWETCDTLDVALGTYKMSADGNKVECNWTKHFQRVLKEEGNQCSDHENRDTSDSGWTEMVETASWKWKHIDLSMTHVGGDESAAGKWEKMEHARLITGGSHILGIPIMPNTSVPMGTYCERFEKNHRPGDAFGILAASRPADELLGLLGVPPESAIRIAIDPA